MGGLLRGVWESLVRLGALHVGVVHHEEAQVLAALGQVGCFLTGATASRGRPPEEPAPGEPRDGRRHG
ncbi:hypothetical protein NFX46_25020 [Streptomyces phaeoluteigriseus]|uniref:Uncharacterized protein n=1 Tax=Streptomyces phaeoluteigriseus TaxID=114686 RepID=A0ABY4ZCD9_9ACTN|nr:hypothetical protein [Streptomyces phaeoluteigriseus]USQ86678.1 hypothetical protein NFX46_25020 [Streptomyces phaeoluteigriseus]